MAYVDKFVAVIKNNGKILREVNRSISLPFGSEYSILLKNNNNLKALVDIEVDGVKALQGKLILPSNSSTEIYGFMKSMSVTNKFKFIRKTDEISNHRGDRIEDGTIKIEFQLEAPTFISPYSPYYPYYPDFGKDYQPYFSCESNAQHFSDIKYMSSTKSLIDDGITVRGSKINSNFEYGNIGPLSPKKEVIVFILRGHKKKGSTIEKPITVKTKKICDTCGRANKYVNNFCYNCGTCIE